MGHEPGGFRAVERRGLIWAVRDRVERQERIRDGDESRYETVISDPGVDDKRLLVLEEEFASTLRVMGREGNTLSPIIRRAWDDGNLSSLVKNSPCRASGALISIIGHITAHELRQYLDRTEAANGFANRFLFVCVRRSKLLPEGGCLSESDLAPVARQVGQALACARRIEAVRRNDEAALLWRTVYGELSEGRRGLLGAVISRAEAQTMRIAMLYALLDGSSSIAVAHPAGCFGSLGVLRSVGTMHLRQCSRRSGGRHNPSRTGLHAGWPDANRNLWFARAQQS
jgi:Protein of unknown function (DUF3987)